MFCWIYRKAIACAADSQSTPPAWVRRHLEACPACQRFHEQEMGLSAALVRQKPALAEFPPFLHARIVAGLPRQTPEPNLWAMLVPWARAAIIPALSVLLLAGFWAWKLESRKAGTLTAASVETRFAPLLSAAPDADQVLAWGRKLDQPLEGEMKAVVSDARLALNSLSETFLPSQFTPSKD